MGGLFEGNKPIHKKTPEEHSSVEKTTSLNIRSRIGDQKDSIHTEVRNIVKKLVLNNSLRAHYVEHVDDITQDVLLSVWKNAESFHGDSSLSTWLYSIARHRFLDIIRHDANVHINNSESLEDLSCDKPFVLPHNDKLSEEEIIFSLDNESLWVYLKKVLSKEEYKLLDLKFKKGLSTEEICAELILPEGTVKTKLSRLVERIKGFDKVKKMVA